LTGHPDVVVIGAGPAGLATSYELSQAGVEHVVLERGRVGETWRGRW
jgi:putative flavoprotein involved in K+ transport